MIFLKVKPQPQGTLSPPLSQQQQQSSTSTHVFSSTTPQPHTSTTPHANTIPTQATHMNLQVIMIYIIMMFNYLSFIIE